MRNAFTWSVVGLVAVAGIATAQRPRNQGGQPVQPGAVQPARPGVPQSAQSQTADQQIATMIAACNRNEVEISKFALSKLQSSDAKEIATMLIKDHTAGAQKFDKWAGQQQPNVNRTEEGRREEGREDRPGDNEQSKTNPAAPANPGAQPQPQVVLKPALGGGLDWLAVHQEIAQEGLEGCKKELSRYEGKDFDKAFLGHQIGGHLMAATNLKVLKRHASSQLASEIDDALATTESHLKKIRDLMEEQKDK